MVAAAHLALLIYALPRLTTAKIEGARAEALARHEAEQAPGLASPVGTGEARAAEPPAEGGK